MEDAPLTDEEVVLVVEGANTVLEYFGAWESCHDAEILDLRVHLGTCVISLHAVSGAPKQKHAILMFTLRTVQDLSLAGFFPQNQLGGAWFSRVGERLRLTLQGVHGLGGWIEAESVRVDLYPLNVE